MVLALTFTSKPFFYTVCVLYCVCLTNLLNDGLESKVLTFFLLPCAALLFFAGLLVLCRSAC